MKKKFLVLGIGNAQVDLLKYLMPNFELHALSNSKNGRGFTHAQYFSLIDITDRKTVLDYAKTNNIDYIYSIGSDIAMPTVTFVAESLGLPILATRANAEICNNKFKLRCALKEIYGSIPFELVATPKQAVTVTLPAMIKPVDSQGQRGVQTITKLNQIPKAFEIAISYSRCKQAIIEEKIDGQEISVNAYIVNGAMKFFLPSDRIAWPQFDGGVIHKHIIPTTLDQESIENIRKLVLATISKLQINNGPVYFQIIVRKKIPYLIEVTPRLDGCHMWHLILHSTGINLLKNTIFHLQGIAPSFPKKFDIQPNTLEFFCQPPFEIFKKPSPTNSAKYLEYYYSEGEEIKPMNGYMEKSGYQITPNTVII